MEMEEVDVNLIYMKKFEITLMKLLYRNYCRENEERTGFEKLYKILRKKLKYSELVKSFNTN
jgi:hypothetical protein